MKKLFAIVLLMSCFFCASAAVTNDVLGNDEVATELYGFTAATVVLTAVVAQKVMFTNNQLALLSKSYFTADVDPLTRAEKALWEYMSDPDRANKQTTADLQAGKLKITSYAESLKFTIPISTGGRRELLNAATQYFQGRIPEEWNFGALPEGFNIAVTTIGIGYATDAAITVPEGDVDFVNQPNSWPAALRNGQLIISQNGTVKEKFSCRYAGSNAASTNNSVEGDSYELQSPMILEEIKPTKIELFSPQGVNFPATPANLFVEVNLFGAALRQRA